MRFLINVRFSSKKMVSEYNVNKDNEKKTT